MTVRKKRPVLYEVIRPEHHRNDPTQPPAGHRPPAAPPPASIEKSPLPRSAPPKAAPPPSAPAKSTPPAAEHDATAPGRTFTISSQMLAVIAASAIMLICIVFVAGKQFGAKSGDSTPAAFEFNGDEQASEGPIPEAAEPKTSTERPGVRATAEQPKENPPAAKPKETAPTPAPSPVPTVALQKGYTYITVQHFNKSKRADAEAAAVFLRERGVNTALIVGVDIRLMATDGFLTEQRDAAAAEREKRRAGQLQQRVKELGREYDKMLRERNEPSYTFSDCYQSTMK